MKTILIALTASLLLMAPDAIADGKKASDSHPEAQPLPIYNKKRRTLDTPANNVEAEIRDGYLFVNFLESEGAATVTMSEPGNGTIYRAGAQTAAPIVVPAIESEMPVQVVIRTADSNEYEGWIFASPAD